jgi:hypothetical protein
MGIDAENQGRAAQAAACSEIIQKKSMMPTGRNAGVIIPSGNRLRVAFLLCPRQCAHHCTSLAGQALASMVSR